MNEPLPNSEAIKIIRRIKSVVQNIETLIVETGVAPHIPRDGIKGATLGVMQNVVRDAVYRRLILSVLFSVKKEPMSSKSLTLAQWQALISWVDPYKDDTDGQWKAREDFKREAELVLTEALRVFYLNSTQEERSAFGIYDAQDKVATGVAIGGVIRFTDDTTEVIQKPVRPVGPNEMRIMRRSALDRMLFSHIEQDDDESLF